MINATLQMNCHILARFQRALNVSKLHFVRDFFYEIIVDINDLYDDDLQYRTLNDELQFSEKDLKQIVFALGSDYDQENLDLYHFYIQSKLIDEYYEYFIILKNY